MKNKKLIIALIVFLCVLCIGIVILFVNLMNGKFKFNNFKFNNESNELVIDKTYENKFNNISIKTDASNIYIKTNNEDNIKVVIYGDKENTTVNENNTELNINAKSKQCFGFCFNQKISKVEVYLPNTYDKDIVINNDYGNVEIGKFMNANMNIYEDCGNVIISVGNNIKVENDYGNIEIDEVNDANIKASAGNIEIDTVYNLTVKNDYGNIEIGEVLNYINAEEDCGDVTIDNININESSKITNDLGNIKIGNTNEIYIDAKTELGKVNINKNYNSDITLTIENDCGDIKVNN